MKRRYLLALLPLLAPVCKPKDTRIPGQPPAPDVTVPVARLVCVARLVTAGQRTGRPPNT